MVPPKYPASNTGQRRARNLADVCQEIPQRNERRTCPVQCLLSGKFKTDVRQLQYAPPGDVSGRRILREMVLFAQVVALSGTIFQAITESEFLAIPSDTSEVRLYVDGDFESVERLAWWMRIVAMRPDLDCYGYSKSWQEFLMFFNSGGQFPDNYTLNVSNGSIHDANQVLKDSILALPCTRNEFAGVAIEGDFARGFERYKDPAYHQAVRAAGQREFGRKVISCPGQCDDCGHGRAMCANKSIDVPILIGIH